MSDIYTKIFTGNLTSDATYKKLDGDKSPINFSVAVNFSNGSTIYQTCVYWISTKENPELLKYLLKGTKLTLTSNYSEIKEWEDKDGNKKSTETAFINQLVLGSSKNKPDETDNSSAST